MGVSGNPAKKGNNKKTPKAEKFEAVAESPYADLPKAEPLQSKEQFDQIMNTVHTRPSSAKPRPVDEEGIPYLTNAELSSVYRVHPDTVKRWTHGREIPHYVEQRGLGRQTEGKDPLEVDPMQRGTRTWHKLSEVVSFLNDRGHTAGVAAARDLATHRENIRKRKAAGETVPTLHDNPAHPGLADALFKFESGRRVTPSLTPPAEERGESFEAGMFTSNIMNAVASGSGKVVGSKRKRRKK